MKILFTKLILGLFCLSPAYAEQASDQHRVDRVFGLNQLNNLSISASDNRLVVTLSDRVLQFSTFPLIVTADVELIEPKIEGINSIVNGDQTLVVLGINSDGGRNEGRMRIYQDIERTLEGPIKEVVEIELDTSPFSQALIKDQDEILAVNSNWPAVILASIRELTALKEDDPLRLSELHLQCGRAGAISIFSHGETEHYVASGADSKLIELGPFIKNLKQIPDVDCFNPIISVQEKSYTANRQSVLHKLIDNPFALEDSREVGKMLLTFDPDDGQINVFPMREFRKKMTLLRSAHYGLNLNDKSKEISRNLGGVGLLAADAKGSVILVSYRGSKVVHRLQNEEETLTYLGRLDLNNPVQRLEVSDDGLLAAVATSDSLDGGLFDIVLIDKPGALGPNEKLSDKMYSVQSIQTRLTDEGFNVFTDGVYGPQTINAISQFLTAQGEPALNGLSAQPVREVTRALTIPKPPVQDAKTEIGKALRGLFPLQ